jgi:hypothetical protein
MDLLLNNLLEGQVGGNINNLEHGFIIVEAE